MAEAPAAALPIAPGGAAVAALDQVPPLVAADDDEEGGWETVEEGSQEA